MTSGPAITSVSLLAKATVLPASTAAHVLRRPAAPTMAETTRSTSGDRTRSSSASGPMASRVPAGRSATARPAAAAASATTTQLGRQARACSTRACVLRLAASRNGTNRPCDAAITSNVLTPTLPVEPSTATFRLPLFEPSQDGGATGWGDEGMRTADGAMGDAGLKCRFIPAKLPLLKTRSPVCPRVFHGIG